MESGSGQFSGPQVRTRAAILEATACVLAQNRSATLLDVAAAANVGRTTVHRYFADRSRLVYEATVDALRLVGQALTDAATNQGPAIDAMRRTIIALVALGDRIIFLYGDPGLLGDIGLEDQLDDDLIIQLIERGQRERTLDPELSVDWIEQVLFALILQGCQSAAAGTMPRHAVAPIVIRTFENGVMPCT